MALTKQDLTKLKDIFATKQDLETIKQELATKQEFSEHVDDFRMLKLDFEELKQNVSLNTENISLLREDVNQIKDDVSSILHELRTEHRIRQLRIEDNTARIQRLEDDFTGYKNKQSDLHP